LIVFDVNGFIRNANQGKLVFGVAPKHQPAKN
jgi:Flp pilus assembly CpaE family ATPase